MLHLLLDMEKANSTYTCQIFNTKSMQYKCLDCLGRPEFCGECLLKEHKYNPNHKVQKWNGHCFLRTTLKEANYILYVGHQGKPCPTSAATDTASGKGEKTNIYPMRIVDVPGEFHHNVQFCSCRGAPPHWEQLFYMGIIPVTTTSPRTAFTFACMNYYRLDSTECKTSASSFTSKQARLSDSLFPSETKARMQKLM